MTIQYKRLQAPDYQLLYRVDVPEISINRLPLIWKLKISCLQLHPTFVPASSVLRLVLVTDLLFGISLLPGYRLLSPIFSAFRTSVFGYVRTRFIHR